MLGCTCVSGAVATIYRSYRQECSRVSWQNPSSTTNEHSDDVESMFGWIAFVPVYVKSHPVDVHKQAASKALGLGPAEAMRTAEHLYLSG